MLKLSVAKIKSKKLELETEIVKLKSDGEEKRKVLHAELLSSNVEKEKADFKRKFVQNRPGLGYIEEGKRLGNVLKNDPPNHARSGLPAVPNTDSTPPKRMWFEGQKAHSIYLKQARNV